MLSREVSLARIVRHDHNFLLTDAITADELIEVDGLLQSHAQRAGLIVFCDQLLGRVNLRNILPAATVKRLQERRESDVVDDCLPIKGEFEIAQTFTGDSGHIVLLRQEHSLWHRHAKFARQRVIEEFIISRPPEWVVHDNGPFERHTFKRGPIERHFVRDAIDYEIVSWRGVVTDAPQGDKFGDHRSISTFIDVSNQSLGKSLFPANQNTNFFH